MSTALWPLQKAIYGRLTADAALMGQVTGVYDEVPEEAQHPFVTFGTVTEDAADAHNQRGLDTDVVLHIWSTYKGNRETADILSALDAVLDRQPLTVAGFTDVSIAQVQHQTLSDPDPDIRHVHVRYRVWLTKEE